MARWYVHFSGIALATCSLVLCGCQSEKTSPTIAKAPEKAAPAVEIQPLPENAEGVTGTGPLVELGPQPSSGEQNPASDQVGELQLSSPSNSDQAAVATGAEMPVQEAEPAADQESALTSTAELAQGEPAVAIAATPDNAANNEAVVPESTKLSPTADSDPPEPIIGNVATAAERNQKIAEDWPKPQAVLFVSGQQQGYLEPCGCTGLESQKGGLIRRDTLLTSLIERGWDVVPLDVGNQNRRKRSTGPQPQIKFATTANALQMMDYRAVALGVHDLELSRVDLLQIAGSEPGGDVDKQKPFICANVTVLLPDFFPTHKIIQVGGRKIGVTAVIGKALENEVKKDPNDDEVAFQDPVESLKLVVPTLKEAGCDFMVLLAHASLEESAELARVVNEFDLVVTAGGFGEPTLKPEPIEGSKAVMVQVGMKGMYGGIIGLYDDPQMPIRYQKIAISSQFKDSNRLLKLFADYQADLKKQGFAGLGLVPALHPTGRKFVGAEACGDCHTQAFEVWKNSPHVHAIDSIVAPNNDRGGIARHYDPECVSCHVTGWNPQQFTPYQSGYVSLEESPDLLGSGCENCHGPGSAHVAAENGDIAATPDELKELREEMILPLARAEEKCMECHDLDNSPDFHHKDAFEKYWEQVKHYGKD